MQVTDFKLSDLTPDEQVIYHAGYAQALADRREKDRIESEQIFRQCSQAPETKRLMMPDPKIERKRRDADLKEAVARAEATVVRSRIGTIFSIEEIASPEIG